MVPPPAEPKNVPSAEEWAQYEAALGCAFPSDYKQIIQTYGDGFFGDWIRLRHPREIIDICKRSGEFWSIVTEFWEDEEFVIYPESEGLLACGHDDGNSQFAWSTKGSPDQWTLINFDNGFSEGSHVFLSVRWHELLVGWFSGTITNPEVGNQWYPEDVEPMQERFFRQS